LHWLLDDLRTKLMSLKPRPLLGIRGMPKSLSAYTRIGVIQALQPMVGGLCLHLERVANIIDQPTEDADEQTKLDEQMAAPCMKAIFECLFYIFDVDELYETEYSSLLHVCCIGYCCRLTDSDPSCCCITSVALCTNIARSIAWRFEHFRVARQNLPTLCMLLGHHSRSNTRQGLDRITACDSTW
jgi:hypothetical protein